jgi:hypothetical protein
MRIAARHHPNAVDGRYLLGLRIELAHSIVLSGRRPITFHPISGAKKLVIGAGDYVGSHGTRQLVDRGDDVRARPNASSAGRPSSSTTRSAGPRGSTWRTDSAARCEDR